MDKQTAKQILLNALTKIRIKDIAHNSDFHMGKGVCERSIMFRIAHYMANDVEECSDLNVDCEYNRRLNEPKSIFDADSSLELARRFFPDIIIHKRGYNDQNFLACEIKLVGQRGKEADRVRLKRLTSDLGQYQYKLGAFILIDQLMNIVRIEFFENGEGLPEQMVISNA